MAKMNHNSAPTASPKMNASALPTMRCANCGNFTFNASYVIKRVSALVSPNGKDTMAPIQVFTCVACGVLLPAPGDNLDFISDIRDEDLASDELTVPDIDTDAPTPTDEDAPLKSNLILL